MRLCIIKCWLKSFEYLHSGRNRIFKKLVSCEGNEVIPKMDKNCLPKRTSSDLKCAIAWEFCILFICVKAVECKIFFNLFDYLLRIIAIAYIFNYKNFQNNLECRKTIKIPEASCLYLTFDHTQASKLYDKIFIYQGKNKGIK